MVNKKCERVHLKDFGKTLGLTPLIFVVLLFAHIVALFLETEWLARLGFKGEPILKYRPIEDFRKDRKLRFKKGGGQKK